MDPESSDPSDVEQVDDVEGENVGDDSDIAADKAAAIGDELIGAVVGEAIILDVLGVIGSGSRRMPSVLTQ
jgi:hypothetical protein